MDYVTATEIKQYGGINWDSSLDTFISTLIGAAGSYVEEFCGDKTFGKRFFKAPDTDADITKRFNGSGEQKQYIGDLRSLTSVTADGIALTLDTDVYLYPLNAQADASDLKPYEWLELVQPETSFANSNPRRGNAIPYVFEPLQRSVVVTGKWGFSATAPEDIKVAVMKIVLSFIKENIGDNDLREVTSETLGEYSISFSKIRDIADRLGVNHILMAYKRKSRKQFGRTIQVS